MEHVTPLRIGCAIAVPKTVREVELVLSNREAVL
jgi:hypothetical protein